MFPIGVDIGKGATVGGFPGGIHRQAEFVQQGTSGYIGDSPDTGLDGAVLVPPRAHDIKAFKRETGRVDILVAARAGGVGAVFRKLLADGGGAAGIGIDGTRFRRRWRDGGTENAVKNPCAPDDGR